MKTFVSFCLLLATALLSRPALATQYSYETASGSCFKASLPPELIPTEGNNYFFNTWSSRVVAIEKISEMDNKVAYLPNGFISVVQDGTNQTAQGPVQYENRIKTTADSSFAKDELKLNLAYDNNFLHVAFYADSDLPYLTAERHTSVSCIVDQHGSRICQKPVVTDSHFAVVTPRNYQPHMILINAQTKLASQHQFDAEKYRQCLEQIH